MKTTDYINSKILKYQRGDTVARRDATYVAPRLNNPQQYKSEEQKARERQPNSEFVTVPPYTTIENGKIVKKPLQRIPNIGAGYVSGTDPVGKFVVANVVAGKPLAWLGKGLEYGAAKAGSQWARNRIVGREVSKQSKNLAKPTYNKPEIPLEENRFYRVGSKEMGDDAVSSGVIRQRSDPKVEEHLANIRKRQESGEKVSLLEKLSIGSRSGNVPYFAREKMYMPPSKSDVVLVGNSRDVPFAQIGPKGRVNKYGLKPSTVEGQSATPYINNEFNTANTNNFQMFKFDPEFGWTRHQLSGKSTSSHVKGNQASFSKAQGNYNLMNQLDEFADNYGYSKSDRSTILSNRKTNKQVRNTIARHNTYMRGVEPYGFEPNDIANVKKVLGDNATQGDILKYVATHKRNPDQGIWITPENNAFIYGGRGNTAYVRRPYKLGTNRSKWLEEGNFNIQQRGTEITAPWHSPQYGKGGPETELISNSNLNFAGWVNPKTYKDKVSLNNRVR